MYDEIWACGEVQPPANFDEITGNAAHLLRVLMRGLLFRIPSVRGAKYSCLNIYEIAQIIEFGDAQPQNKSWTIFSGMDEQCLFGFSPI